MTLSTRNYRAFGQFRRLILRLPSGRSLRRLSYTLTGFACGSGILARMTDSIARLYDAVIGARRGSGEIADGSPVARGPSEDGEEARRRSGRGRHRRHARTAGS